MAKRKQKRPGPSLRRWHRWAGGAAVFVGVVVSVTVLSVRREGDVYHTEPPGEVVAGDRILVEVLNGCGARGAARGAAEVLRARGFDVVRIGNADDFGYENTIVIDRSGSPEKAGAVAGAIHCPRVVTQVANDVFLDVTVVLGADGVWHRGMAAPGGVVGP